MVSVVLALPAVALFVGAMPRHADPSRCLVRFVPKQLTGRANYRSSGRIVGIDQEGDPELARAPEAAARSQMA